MIDEDATFEQFGYKSTDLAPQSNKKIVVICDSCGKVRTVTKQGYHDLCFLCAKCHSKTNYNRTYWENLIMDKLAANPEVPASA